MASRATRELPPLFVKAAQAAKALGVSRYRVVELIHEGRLDAVQWQRAPQFYFSKPATTNRGHWHVTLASLERLLLDAYAGRPVPQSVSRGVLKRAAELSREGSITKRSPSMEGESPVGPPETATAVCPGIVGPSSAPSPQPEIPPAPPGDETP